MDVRRLGASTQVRPVALPVLAEPLGIGLAALPVGMVLVRRDDRPGTWLSAGALSPMQALRLRVLLGFLDTLPEVRSRPGWWSFVCVLDGWREGTRFAEQTRLADRVWQPGDPARAGEAPRLTEDGRPVIAFGRHRGDRSAVLVPEMHYLQSRRYARTRLELTWERRRWSRKTRTAVYAGGDHGDPASFTDAAGPDAHPRARLQRLAAASTEPLEVRLGERMSRRTQLKHQVVIDVDGHARTWDAWFWKMRGGSVVLAQDSVWESFFTEQFEPWEHYVPLANDLSDLDEQLQWCWAHEPECRRIASRAARRARQVYSPRAVAEQAAVNLAPLLD